MKLAFFATAITIFFSAAHVSHAASVDITVPGTSHIWLAGMPNGTTGVGGDVTPTHSPVEVLGLTLTPGETLTFSAMGLVTNGPSLPLVGPDGGGIFSYTGGNANGMSSITGPVNSLLGVFLTDAQPDTNVAPAALDYTTDASREQLSYSPELQQVFFIGDGEIPAGTQQEFVIPTNATRLFLGTHDGFGWFNNQGSFDVNIKFDDVPPPPHTGYSFACGWRIAVDRSFRAGAGSSAGPSLAQHLLTAPETGAGV